MNENSEEPIRTDLQMLRKRMKDAEMRESSLKQQLETLAIEVGRVKRRQNGSFGIFVFVLLALCLYHWLFVVPIKNSVEGLITTFNQNVDRHNAGLNR
jgi:hypothetical protein